MSADTSMASPISSSELPPHTQGRTSLKITSSDSHRESLVQPAAVAALTQDCCRHGTWSSLLMLQILLQLLRSQLWLSLLCSGPARTCCCRSSWLSLLLSKISILLLVEFADVAVLGYARCRRNAWSRPRLSLLLVKLAAVAAPGYARS